MTTPTPGPDWAPAEVKIGLSEILLLLGFISSILTSYFGHDWGISKNAQALAGLGVILIPALTGLIRAQKHRGAQQANATVAAAQLQAAALVAAARPNDANQALETASGGPAAPPASRAARVQRSKAKKP